MKKGVIGIVAAVVAVAAIVGVVMLTKKDTKKSNDTASTNSSTTPSPSSNSSSDMSNMPKTGDNGSNAVATNSVSIADFAFSPANITVKKGTAVTWTNNDSAQHTVTGDADGGPHSQPLSKGDSYTFTFNTAGTFSYHCSFHSNMTGKVVVTE
jgi:plastocyanin